MVAVHLTKSPEETGDPRRRHRHRLAEPEETHAVTRQRHSATHAAQPLVCRIPMATTPTLSEIAPHSGPHAGRDGLLLFAHRIGIDGRNFEDRVAHPLRQHMQGDALGDGIDGIAMAEAFGDTVGTCGDVRLLHHGHHASPRGGTGPGPQRLIQVAPAGASLNFFEAVHHVECVQQDGRHGHRSVHTFAAFFQAFNDDHLVRKIHPPGGEVEGFGDTAPGVIEDATKGAHGPIVPQGGAEERVALPRCEVQAPAKGIVEIGRVMYNGTGYKYWTKSLRDSL